MNSQMTHTVYVRYLSWAALGCLLAVAVVTGAPVRAQVNDGSIARTYAVSGTQPVSGDIISLDRTKQTLHLADVPNDASLYGVVVSDPVILLQSSGTNVPIVTSGDATVNVTTEGGPIAPGDFITSSSVPGKGRLATSTDTFVLGMALAAFPASTTPASAKAPASGSIPVLIEIGPYANHQASSGETATGTAATAAQSKQQTPSLGVPVFVRYLLAAIVAIGSVSLAFRNFGSSIRDSIISVGRNPLAKSSIQSMVILNAILIALVSAGGLFIGFAILFLPI